MPQWVQHILDFLNQPIVKMASVFIATALLRAWPKFRNEAAPIWTGIYSIVTTVLGLLGVDTSQGEVHASVATYVVASSHWWGGLLQAVMYNAIIPWLTGFGGQRAMANTGKFVTGAPVITESGRQIPTKPLQTFVRQ